MNYVEFAPTANCPVIDLAEDTEWQREYLKKLRGREKCARTLIHPRPDGFPDFGSMDNPVPGSSVEWYRDPNNDSDDYSPNNSDDADDGVQQISERLASTTVEPAPTVPAENLERKDMVQDGESTDVTMLPTDKVTTTPETGSLSEPTAPANAESTADAVVHQMDEDVSPTDDASYTDASDKEGRQQDRQQWRTAERDDHAFEPDWDEDPSDCADAGWYDVGYPSAYPYGRYPSYERRQRR